MDRYFWEKKGEYLRTMIKWRRKKTVTKSKKMHMRKLNHQKRLAKDPKETKEHRPVQDFPKQAQELDKAAAS